MGVMGWSYGGYMTSWVITQTKRFKAASVGAGGHEPDEFHWHADIPSFVPDYFGGEYLGGFRSLANAFCHVQREGCVDADAHPAWRRRR
jgi:hypothetical protein